MSCRDGLALGIAFTCPADLKLYATSEFLKLLSHFFAASDLPYALAAMQAHEMGHVVQYAVHQPGINDRSTDAVSRAIEQQADCLSGVWARHQAVKGGVDVARFRRVAVEGITLISSNAEIATHGTPAQRGAAIDRGLSGGRPQACKLATFQ
ncbi:MAG: neutral zinc metallopeptidase [Jatrophihabitantaceae bacterium]